MSASSNTTKREQYRLTLDIVNLHIRHNPPISIKNRKIGHFCVFQSRRCGSKNQAYEKFCTFLSSSVSKYSMQYKKQLVAQLENCYFTSQKRKQLCITFVATDFSFLKLKSCNIAGWLFYTCI